MSEALVNISNLEYRYGNHTKASFKLESLQLKPGETVFLKGPSGTGKSTLLNLIAGIWRAESGCIDVLGQDLIKLNGKQRDKFRAQNLSFVSQTLNLVTYLTAFENVELALYLAGMEADKALIQSLFLQLNLDQQVQNQSVSTLSLGQQQRVAIVRALVTKPKLILADEPTSALDEENARDFMVTLFDLVKAQNIALLFVSHENQWQEKFDRVVNLADLATMRREA